jgi:hypothetical protein
VQGQELARQARGIGDRLLQFGGGGRLGSETTPSADACSRAFSASSPNSSRMCLQDVSVGPPQRASA